MTGNITSGCWSQESMIIPTKRVQSRTVKTPHVTSKLCNLRRSQQADWAVPPVPAIVCNDLLVGASLEPEPPAHYTIRRLPPSARPASGGSSAVAVQFSITQPAYPRLPRTASLARTRKVRFQTPVSHRIRSASTANRARIAFPALSSGLTGPFGSLLSRSVWEFVWAAGGLGLRPRVRVALPRARCTTSVTSRAVSAGYTRNGWKADLVPAWDHGRVISTPHSKPTPSGQREDQLPAFQR